ncbi:MAG TPA: hypothetical protein VH105_10635, partial [Burkholderiales bacterium]|nr:hypothetical protein [Burkholderiales bacterium]
MLLCVFGSAPAAAADIIALVTKVEGDVALTGPKDQPLTQPFIKLREADVLRLGVGAALTLTFFESGRQENWKGPGSIKLAADQSQPAGGAPVLNVKQLPVSLVRQLARTPAPDTDGNVGMLRLRSIPTAEALGKLEKNYNDLKAAAAPGDRDPDLYLLSGLFELHEYDRLEKELARLTEAN